jgi:hypothetical protein
MLEWLRSYLSDVTRGLERFCGRYYGVYQGRVIDNRDPQGRGRVRATCPAINMPKPEDVPGGYWMVPLSPGLGTVDGNTSGVFFPPEEGANIGIKFEFGSPDRPFYIGGYSTTKQTSTTFDSDDMENKGPTKRGMKTKAGHYLFFNDDPDKLEIKIVKGDGNGIETTQFLAFDQNGNTIITNKNGSSLYMNAEDNETSLQTLDDSGNVLSFLMCGDDKVSLGTKSGGVISIDGKNVTITGDNVVADCNRDFSANAGSVHLGQNASQPIPRGLKLMQWELLHQHTSSAPGAPTTVGMTAPLLIGSELSDCIYIK